MKKIHVAASAIIPAPAAQIYALLADYRNGHPLVLPKEHFQDLRVEVGGTGVGTIITFVSRAAGRTRHFRMMISEPEPGCVLCESDIESDLVTTFTVTPISDTQAELQIATDWTPASGLQGMVESWFAPGVMRTIFVRELHQIVEVLREKAGVFQY